MKFSIRKHKSLRMSVIKGQGSKKILTPFPTPALSHFKTLLSMTVTHIYCKKCLIGVLKVTAPTVPLQQFPFDPQD